MSTVYTDTVKTLSPSQDLTIGTTGQTVTLPGNDLRVNTVKDAGGYTLWISDGSGNVSSVNSGLKGALSLISTQNASASANISITTGIDSTYDVYVFKFIDINPQTFRSEFTFQASINGGSSYGVSMTTTYIRAYHRESGALSGFGYDGARDLASSTSYMQLMSDIVTDADSGSSGVLHLFGLSSTTYVKNWYCRTSNAHSTGSDPAARDVLTAGFFNTTSAINAIDFKMDTGNINAGIIKMYGLS